MASILCLAHYCDTHGPTPLMVTEGFAIACQSCHIDDDPRRERRSSTSCQPKTSEEAENSKQAFTRAKSSFSDKENETQKTAQPHTPRLEFSSALGTPPESPKLAALSITKSHRRDSSFLKTYDENDRKRAIPCENCALTLPKKVKEQIPEGAPGSPMKSGKGDNGSPILRTRKAYERISAVTDNASAKSTPSNSDSDAPRRTIKRAATASSISSFASSNSQAHSHYIEYTSTHDPISSSSFSILRASCLRTLSCETLPPTAAPTTPTSPSSYNPYKPSPYGPSSASTTNTSSGGPIFFGDPLAGYTTAFIFRVPDPCARGRRRVYAFIHLSSSRERAAMRTFAFLAAKFRDLAAWIQGLAEAEADRLDSSNSSSARGHGNTNGHSPEGTQTPTASSSLNQHSHSPHTPSSTNPDSSSSSASSKREKLSFTPTSAFLSGRASDADPFQRKGGLGMMGGIRSRGLAELVGKPEFFIELHAQFVRLLAELSALLGGAGN